jgi:hypothetical protein
MKTLQPTVNRQQYNSLKHSAVLFLTSSLLFMLLAFSANSQSINLQLTPSLYGGDFNISCFGSSDGSINLTVTGGTPPYTYHWSNNATTQDINNLAAGYYAVNVSDANNNFATTQITLIQPPSLEVFINVFTYPNKFNISCFDCYNGMISTEVDGGVYPYEYVWPDDDAITSPERLGLGSGTYQVLVIDLNGCRAESYSGYLTAPERSDWTMGGNEGTNPVSDYIGTSDETDLVFRTNSSETMRLTSYGEVNFLDLAGDGLGALVADENGRITAVRPGTTEPDHSLTWYTFGNNLNTLEPPASQFLGTRNETDLIIKTNNIQRMVVKSNGKVGINYEPPATSNDFKLYVGGGIYARQVKVTLYAFADDVFSPEYQLPSLAELSEYIQENRHLPGIPSEKEVVANDGIELGDMQVRLLRKTEELTLYILQQQRLIDELRNRIQVLENQN